jgi:hypothetical protein
MKFETYFWSFHSDCVYPLFWRHSISIIWEVDIMSVVFTQQSVLSADWPHTTQGAASGVRWSGRTSLKQHGLLDDDDDDDYLTEAPLPSQSMVGEDTSGHLIPPTAPSWVSTCWANQSILCCWHNAHHMNSWWLKSVAETTPHSYGCAPGKASLQVINLLRYMCLFRVTFVWCDRSVMKAETFDWLKPAAGSDICVSDLFWGSCPLSGAWFLQRIQCIWLICHLRTPVSMPTMVTQLHQHHHLELLASPSHRQLDCSLQPVSATIPKLKPEPLHRLRIVTRKLLFTLLLYFL